MTHDSLPPGSIVLAPEQGRAYEMGFMRAVFKADGAETDDRYSVSEWWMEPRNTGPGAHHHKDNDEVFYVLEGTVTCSPVAPSVDMRVRHQETDDEEEPVQRGADHRCAA
jgi:mannose-6-phosphate isomerase-like protein (cupin superfamily)